MRWLLTVVLLFAAIPAWAGELAVVDFQRAVNETTEGKAAQAKLNSEFQTRQAGIERLGAELKQLFSDYESRKGLLSATARAAEEQKIMEKQAAFEQMRMQAESEMQEQYMSLLQGLDAKMRTVTTAIAQEKQLDIVLDRSTLVYVKPGIIDLTDELIRRYNAGSK